jgi:hypothetical protein
MFLEIDMLANARNDFCIARSKTNLGIKRAWVKVKRAIS